MKTYRIQYELRYIYDITINSTVKRYSTNKRLDYKKTLASIYKEFGPNCKPLIQYIVSAKVEF